MSSNLNKRELLALLSSASIFINKQEKGLVEQMMKLINENPEFTVPESSLHLVKGGKFGGDENWLQALPVGTVFLCRSGNANQPFLQEFEILNHFENATFLVNDTNDEVFTWVDSMKFSQTFSKFCIFAEGQDE
jgi:hypothetical protein